MVSMRTLNYIMAELKTIERLVDDLVTRVEALEEKAEEIWVPVKDNLGYFISNKGRVKTYDDFYPKITLDKGSGYYRVKLNGKLYYLHRLLAQAFIPNPENKPEVDHIDGNKQNNCLSNLRWATRAENNRNVGKRKDNTSEFKGVCFDKWNGKWKARIWVDGKRKLLGYFRTKEEAAAAYEKAARELHGEFYRAPE